MAFFNFFKNKNRNELSHDEKEAAEILKNIVYGYKHGEPDFMHNGIEKLSIGLYYLAFKRSNKKVVRLEEINDPLNFLTNPKTTHYIHYLGIYSAIKESIEAFCNDSIVLTHNSSLKEYENTILLMLKYTAEKINKIRT